MLLKLIFILGKVKPRLSDLNELRIQKMKMNRWRSQKT